MESVISFPNRGHWGKSTWRGNCSGHVIKELIEHFRPSLFVDVCEGSGTSREVCQEMSVTYVGLDLHKGNDFTHDYVLSQLPFPADLVFSHPPYADIIKYSGEVWGGININDTSRCQTVEEFLEKSQIMLLNQREATKENGVYTTLIGDIRKNGTFRSLQADFFKMMPREELKSVTIKIQHNTVSDRKNYCGSFIPIKHEYLLVWQKGVKTIYQITWEKAFEYKREIEKTWRSLIRVVLMNQNGPTTLATIYKAVEEIAEAKIKNNQHWKAKIRQELQKHFTNIERGVWAA